MIEKYITLDLLTLALKICGAEKHLYFENFLYPQCKDVHVLHDV